MRIKSRFTPMRLALSSIKSRRPLSPSVRSTKTRKRKRHGTRSKPVHAPGEAAHSAEQNRLLTNMVRGEGNLTIRLTRGEIITSLINVARMGTSIIYYRISRNMVSVCLLISLKIGNVIWHCISK